MSGSVGMDLKLLLFKLIMQVDRVGAGVPPCQDRNDY